MNKKLRGIKCVAPVFDGSGYAEWSRNYILALNETKIPITLAPIKFEEKGPDLGEIGNTLNSLVGKDIEYDAIISWTTPEIAEKVFNGDTNKKALRINFTLWETDLLHPAWVNIINKMDECWLPGDFNRKVFRDSKVTVPLKTFHHPIDLESYGQGSPISLKRSASEIIGNDTYVFYYISQWSERKNFKDLLQAYWSEFSNGENVCLVLKTYLAKHSQEESEYLSEVIEQIQSQGKYTQVPEVILVNQLLSREKMLGLHKRCDCYVSPSRGEGLGLGILESGIFENPVITNTFGEQASYVTSDTGFIYNHTLRPVTGMQQWPWYLSNQYWAQPDLKDMTSKMRFCYENQELAKEKGRNLRQFLETNCTYRSVGDSLVVELNESFNRLRNNGKNKESISVRPSNKVRKKTVSNQKDN